MERDELFAAMAAARPARDDLVYVQRSGQEYAWRAVTDAAPMVPVVTGPDAPDVWMYFSAAWPLGDAARLRAFFDDMLAEMESMAGSDRCRWPLDAPWPLSH